MSKAFWFIVYSPVSEYNWVRVEVSNTIQSDGKVSNIFKDDEHGISVKIESANNIVVVYSNLDEKTNVKKGQEVKEGQVLGTVGNTTSVECEDETHIHIEAFKGKESIDPMTIIK